jgi:ubiquinone/menaquinone biosynthesis C-methylase UbiE
MSDYDDEIWRLVPDEPGPPAEHLARFVRGLDPAGSVLDLGCGDGRLTRELRASELVGADVSGVALERARRHLPDAELIQLEPDARLPLEDSRFELVLCAETLEHVRDVQLLLSEARRVLRPGGTLAVTTPAHGRVTGLELLALGFERRFDPFSPHLRFFSRRSLRAALADTGLEVRTLRRSRGTLLCTAVR